MPRAMPSEETRTRTSLPGARQRRMSSARCGWEREEENSRTAPTPFSMPPGLVLRSLGLVGGASRPCSWRRRQRRCVESREEVKMRTRPPPVACWPWAGVVVSSA